MEIEHIIISIPGDPSVGIFEQSIIVKDGSNNPSWIYDLSIFVDNDREDEINRIRALMEEAFGEMFGEKVVVNIKLKEAPDEK